MDGVKLMCGCAAVLAISTQWVHVPAEQRQAVLSGVEFLLGRPAASSSITSPNASAAALAPLPQPTAVSLNQTETIAPDRFGQFQTMMEVEGQRLSVLVDTGASFVVLSSDDADRLALRPAPSDFKYKVSTANGTAYVAKAELREIRVGNIVVRNVPALIGSRGALVESLLGMSFLRKLGSYKVDAGRLVLQQ